MSENETPDLNFDFKSIILRSGLPLKTFSIATGLKPSEAMEWWRGSSQINGIDNKIACFENFFGITFESVKENSEGFQLLRQRIHGDYGSLPEKYAIGAQSRARSSFYIVEYLRYLYGQQFVDRLLSSLLVHPRFFEDLDRTINIRFIDDLLGYCAQIGFQKKDFESLAQSMFLSIENSDLEQSFQDCSNYQHFFEVLSDHLTAFDNNFTYEIIARETDFELSSKLREDVQEALSKQSNPSQFRRVFSYRPILFSRIPCLAGLDPLATEVIQCESRGDQSSLFRGVIRTKGLRAVAPLGDQSV